MKRFFIALIGGTVLAIGIALIVLPGPAFLVIPAGLGILATEFLWARTALRRCKCTVHRIRRRRSLRSVFALFRKPAAAARQGTKLDPATFRSTS